MSTSLWSAVPVVLVLLLSALFPTPISPDITDDNRQVTADGAGDVITTESTGELIQEPGGSGSGSGSALESASGGGVPVCGVTGVTVMLPGGDRAEYRLCRRVEPVVSADGAPMVVRASNISTLLADGSVLFRPAPAGERDGHHHRGLRSR